MLIQSKWRVTLGDPSAGGIVLLDFGDSTQDEPEVARACQNDIARPLRSPWAVPIRSYNIEHTLRIGRVVVFATDDEARDYLKSHTAALPFGSALSLTIEEIGKPIVVLINALLQPGYTARTESNQCHLKYTIIGGELQVSETIPTEPPPPSTSTAPYLFLDDSGGLSLRQAGGAIKQITDGAGNLYVGPSMRLVPLSTGAKIQVLSGSTWIDNGTQFTT